jgi:hypothetical protein
MTLVIDSLPIFLPEGLAKTVFCAVKGKARYL